MRFAQGERNASLMTVGHERVGRRKFSVPPEGNIRKRGAGCNEENEDSEERVSRVCLLVSWVADNGMRVWHLDSERRTSVRRAARRCLAKPAAVQRAASPRHGGLTSARSLSDRVLPEG